MLNVVELEKRWFKYKVKSYIPIISIFLSLLIIMTILVFSLPVSNFPMPITQEKIESPEPTPTAKVVIEQSPQKPATIKEPLEEKQYLQETSSSAPIEQKPIRRESDKIKLSPSLDFMKKMQNSLQPYYINESLHTNSLNDQQPKEKNIVQKKPEQKPNIQSEPLVVQNKERVQIKRQNTQNDIYDIIKRFKKNNNPALSLFVAKKYYELQNYRQAYNYALITNKINKEIEASWIIFSKSLVKLGKRDKAITTLRKYIKHSQSNGAQILLDEIESGKFQ